MGAFMVDTIDSALRDNNTLGDPGSGDYKVKKGPLRTVLKRIEASAGIGAVTVATKAELDAITDKADNAPGFVVGDSAASNNGQYSWDDSGSAWVKIRALPDTLAVLENIGGTANAITADTATGVDPAVVQAIVLTAPPGTNASGAVTITLNSGSAESIKSASGTNPAAGDIVEDVATIFFKVGSEWRQIFTSNPNATFDHQGDYAGGTTYTLDQVVTGSDGNWYQLKVSSATGDDPVSGGSGNWLRILDGAVIADNSITVAKLTAAARAKTVGFKTVALFEADTELDYTVLTAGDVILAGGYRLDVLASGASDNHLANSNGTPVKVKVLKRNNTWPMLAFNPNADGATDDKAKIDLVNNSGEVVDLGGKSYEYGGAFTPAATFINGSIIDDNQTRDYTVKTAHSTFYDPNGALPRLKYNGPTSVESAISSYSLGGFWYRGRYTNQLARSIPVSDSVFDWTTDYGAGSIKLESWQACFMCATKSETVAAPKIMPYLRVHSVSGNVVTLNKAGEGIGTQDAASDYGWSNDELIGAKCLVISEAGEFTNARITEVTDNTKTTVTLADIGTIGGTFSGAASLDWLLIAPPGYDLDEFVWIGDFYADNAEVRNTYWSGTSAKGKMIYILDPSSHLTGAVAAPGALINTGGYISPLATGVHMDVSCVLSTAGTGGFAEYFDVDGGNHIVQSKYVDKVGTGSLSVQNDGVMVPFLYHGRFYYSNAGSTAAARINGQLNITGWEF